MISQLLLLSGNDIPFPEANLVIHQPIMKEIAYIGEKTFFTGCQLLSFSKEEDLDEKDKILSASLTDFEVLMTMIKQKDVFMQKRKVSMEMVLWLLFPDYKINFLPMRKMFTKDGENFLIDKDNFNQFKNILLTIFCLKTKGTSKYNPGGPQAQAIVNKFKQRDKRLAKLRSQNKQSDEINIFSHYISILSVGQQKTMTDLFQYTVYQLENEFRRFKAKQNFDMYVKLKTAGAKNVEQVENWMKEEFSTD